MSNRKLNDFISGYLEYGKETESPTQYHLWCGIAAIASALQRKCRLPWGVETIYPNHYIVLIGPSGKCRKGVAMGICYDIVTEAGIKCAAESITREALIKDFKEAIASYSDPGGDGGIKYHCSLTVFSEELSIFLGNKDVRFLADLTDWYNCKNEWTYRTKNMGTDKITSMCMNILGATAPDWLTSILPQEAVGGGFTSRIIFIAESEKRAVVSRPFVPDYELRDALINDLERISTLCGEFTFSEDAFKLYVPWYENHSKNPVIKDPRFQGYNERKATHIRKLAMVCSVSRGDSLIIEGEDFERARLIIEASEKGMPKVFRGLGKARYSEITMYVFDFIVQRGTVGKGEIMRKFHMDLDDYTMDIVSKTLQSMGVIKVEYPQGKEAVYKSVSKVNL